MNDTAINMVEIEGRLADDDDGSALSDVRGAIGDWRADARRHIDAGLPPAEFEIARKWAAALDAAEAVVARYWKLRRPAAPGA